MLVYQLLGFDSECPERGPVFRVPVTVTIPEPVQVNCAKSFFFVFSILLSVMLSLFLVSSSHTPISLLFRFEFISLVLFSCLSWLRAAKRLLALCTASPTWHSSLRPLREGSLLCPQTLLGLVSVEIFKQGWGADTLLEFALRRSKIVTHGSRFSCFLHLFAPFFSRNYQTTITKRFS